MNLTPAGGVTVASEIVSPITISETSTVICSGISVGSASTVTSRVTCSSTPPSLTPGAWSVALQLDRDLGLDLLVEPHLEAVEVDDVAAERVVLLLLDHHRHGRRAVELEVEQGVALGEQRAQLALGDLEGARLAALAVDDAGHQPLAAQAAAGARAEAVSGGDVECGAILRPLAKVRVTDRGLRPDRM